MTFDGIVEGHDGEIFGLAFTPDGVTIATAGWDGFLRFWDPTSATPLSKLRASSKPLSAVTISPDGKHYLTGSMEGILTFWDTATQQPMESTVAHTRPIAGIRFSADSRLLATAGWDRQIQLRKLDSKHRDVKTLNGHQDILAGCAFFPDGKELLSWGADGTLRIWDTGTGRETHALAAHEDRVTAAALSPDGALALSGSRNGKIKLWDLKERREVISLALGTEIRGIFFLLDAESAIAVDSAGSVVLLSLPTFQVESEIEVGHKVMCADLSPSGTQLALGGEDGYLYLVSIQGEVSAPLYVTPQRTRKAATGLLNRWFRGLTSLDAFEVTCPRCRTINEMRSLPEKPISCRSCGQSLRLNAKAVAVG